MRKHDTTSETQTIPDKEQMGTQGLHTRSAIKEKTEQVWVTN